MKNILLSSAIITTLSLFTVTQALAETAFGLTLGQTLPDGAEPSSSDGRYNLTPPKTHSLFQGYRIVYHQDYGICSIFAFGSSNKNDKYGTDGKSQYNKIKKSLNKKYENQEILKESKTFEYLKSNALWKEESQFAMSLQEGDRAHSTYWTFENGDLKEIGLGISSIRYEETYISLYYDASFIDECEDSIGSADEDAL